MVEDVDRQILEGSERTIVEEPVHIQHMRLRLIGTGRVRMLLPLGFRDGLLLPHNLTLGFTLGRRTKLRKIFVHDLKPLGNVVVAGKVNARVGRMVELGMEIGKVLERKLGNDRRVST